LQVGPAAADIQAGGAEVLVDDLSPQLRDWADTAAYMADLDLIISVDSAPLHLAGAMGRLCIGLLPFVGCWRWGVPGDVLTPWYPTMSLLRQYEPGDWRGPIARLIQIVRNMRELRVQRP
jgi:ADP-heptose:LPS heptosyltransferase